MTKKAEKKKKKRKERKEKGRKCQESVYREMNEKYYIEFIGYRTCIVALTSAK